MCACSHPEGATDAMQSSMTEPMLNSTGNASTTQRLLEGQTGPTAAAQTLSKRDGWVQAGKTLFQRATGTLRMRVYSNVDLFKNPKLTAHLMMWASVALAECSSQTLERCTNE